MTSTSEEQTSIKKWLVTGTAKREKVNRKKETYFHSRSKNNSTKE
jgi:hypothetical protein